MLAYYGTILSVFGTVYLGYVAIKQNDRLMKLEREYIQYVMKCLNENSTKVRNMKQYVLATLYNAPLTISNFHKSWVNYDMANGLI